MRPASEVAAKFFESPESRRELTAAIERDRAEVRAAALEEAAAHQILEDVLRAWSGGLYGDGVPANNDNAAKWMGLGNHDEGSREPSVVAFYDALCRGRKYFRDFRTLATRSTEEPTK